MEDKPEKTTRKALLVKNKEGIYLQEHRELFLAARFVLRSAIGLIQASGGKIFLKTEKGKVRILRVDDEPILSLEREFARRAYKGGSSLVVMQGQPFYNEEGKFLGVSHASYLVTPIYIKKGMPIGVILLKNKLVTGQFNEQDVSLLQACANTFGRLISGTWLDPVNGRLVVSFAKNLLALIENLYLYKNHVDTNFLLSEMIKVSKLINSSLDLQSLLESIMESAKLVLKAEASSLMLIDPNTNELYFNTITGEKERALKQIRIPMGVGIAGYVAQTKESLIVNDAQNDPRLFRQADQTINFVTRNMIATPLLVRNRVIGVIEVINSIGRDEFTEKDLELFRSFAEQSALAIHNRELIDSLKEINKELKKKVHELSSLHEISKALISNLREQDLYDSVVKIISEELQAKKVFIMLFDKDRKNLKIVSQLGLEIQDTKEVSVEKSLSGLAFKEKKLIYTNDLANSPYAIYQNEEKFLSGACIIHPLAANEEVYGVLNISEKVQEGGFSEDDLRLVSTIAVQITKGIQNFRLLEEMMAKRAYEKELEITSSIQKSILPSHKLPSGKVELGVLSVPAKVMGGDFYDFYYFSQKDMYIFSIADVSGKSLPAALFMAVTSSILRTISREGHYPKETLYKANDLIYQDSHSGMFVTLFYTLYEPQTRQLFYASAGHNEQLIYHPQKNQFEVLRSRGRPLGILDSATHGPFGEGRIQLQVGDMVILYTDGVVEAINENQEEFGMERFKKAIAQNYLLPAQDIVKKIYETVREFSGTEGLYDDFTLLVVKIVG